jgi:Zn-dependent protease with chaperone function
MVLGRYFYPNSARFVAARATIGGKRILTITTEAGAPLAEVPFRRVKITPRLADLPRRLMLPDGACFETLDNDGVDGLIGEARHFLTGGWMDRLERSWKAILISVVLAAGSAAAFVHWGIPALSYRLAINTPEWLAVMVSDQTMTVLEQRYIRPTQLSDAEQAKVRRVFDVVAKSGACGAHVCRLEFRSSGAIGANAFALPDGRVVVTDALVHLAFNDDELAGVFAHEMAHVRRAHGLTRVYEASLLPAAIVVLTGDISQVSQIAVVLPGILIQSAYSRDFESEADADAVATLKKLRKRPGAMADLLERMEKSHCGGHGCGSSWLGDHPDTASRAARFRNGR